jgi:hypothetical protein
MNNVQLQFIFDCDVEELVSLLMDDYGMDMIKAFDTVYNSEIYKKLINTKTGLYLQSPGYIYSYLKEEIESNQDSDKEIS